MSLLSLTPGVGPLVDAGGSGGRQPKPPSKSDLDATLRRDQNTCRFCGFQASRFQRVLPWESTETKDKLITSCSFCEQVVRMERAGPTGSVFLIWLPELTQAQLHHILRAIYIARATEGPLAAQANKALDALVARRAEAKKRLGSDDPLLLATVFQEELSPDDLLAAQKRLDGIRLLPADKWYVHGPKGDVDRFPDLITYWQSKEGPFGKLPVEKWADLFTETLSKVGHA